MSVYIYPGCLKIVSKSGIGQAIYHQKRMLESVGEDVTMKDYKKSDIVHVNTIFPDSPIIAYLAKKKGKKVIYYGHSTMEDFKNSFIGSNKLAPLFKRWIKFCYSFGDIIITPTEYSKELLESYNMKKTIFALSNGVDTDKFKFKEESRRKFREKYKIDDNEKVIISVGHYIERKGILDFIELSKRIPDKKFFWFGYTDKKLVPEHVREAIKNAPKNLSFPGYINQEELKDAYCGCDIFAFTSKEETEGIVVLEALACGTETIVRDIPVYYGWLEDNKNVYKAKNIDEFESLISKICNREIPDLSEEGLKVAKERSIESVGERLTRIHEILINMK